MINLIVAKIYIHCFIALYYFIYCLYKITKLSSKKQLKSLSLLSRICFFCLSGLKIYKFTILFNCNHLLPCWITFS